MSCAAKARCSFSAGAQERARRRQVARGHRLEQVLVHARPARGRARPRPRWRWRCAPCRRSRRAAAPASRCRGRSRTGASPVSPSSSTLLSLVSLWVRRVRACPGPARSRRRSTIAFAGEGEAHLFRGLARASGRVRGQGPPEVLEPAPRVVEPRDGLRHLGPVVVEEEPLEVAEGPRGLEGLGRGLGGVDAPGPRR